MVVVWALPYATHVCIWSDPDWTVLTVVYFPLKARC